MSKVNTIKIRQSTVLALLMLTIFVLGVTLPMRALGYDEGIARPYNRPVLPTQPEVVYVTVPVERPVTVYQPTQQTVYRQVNTYPDDVVYKYPNELGETQTVEEKYGGLAASAVYGDNTFAPSGLTQWILLAILILVIIILARKIFGAQQRYHESPLKHA